MNCAWDSFARRRGRPDEGLVLVGTEIGRPLLLQMLGFPIHPAKLSKPTDRENIALD